MKIRLYNAKILTMEKDCPIFAGEIWIKNEKIVRVLTGMERIVSEPNGICWDIQVDCEGNLLMPGFKNAHTHSAMTFLRSYADDLPLEKWLNEKIFPMEAKLTPEDIYELTRLAVLEYLTSGVTSIFDMYVNPEAVARGCMDMGMRCVLVPGLNNFVSSPGQVEEEYIKWNRKDSLISYQLGFHAEYTCSKELLCKVSDLAHKYHAPVYTHLAETEKEVRECRERYGMTPAVFLDSLGMFEFGGGGFHCVHMTPQDMEIFKKRRLHVITNPASNLKLASGIAPIAEFERRRIPVSIGTDGPASNNCLDMFREMFLVAGLSKVREGDAASLSAERVLRMATVHGAKAMRLNKADTLAKGKYADIILIDLNQPNMQPLNNVLGNLVYSGSKTNVRMTMINGKILYKDGRFFVGERPESIYNRCNAILQRMLAE
jgi:5-methylthioadenosine/S-adenosylhomocysteine deaminase